MDASLLRGCEIVTLRLNSRQSRRNHQYGVDPLMDTASKCPECDRPRSSLNHRGSAMNRNTGMNAGQIIGTMNGQQVVGLDIAKQVFQMHTVNMGTGEIVNVRVLRAKVLEHFANLTPCLVAIEACGGAHHWARDTQANSAIRCDCCTPKSCVPLSLATRPMPPMPVPSGWRCNSLE